jgi:phospholipase C
VFCSGNVARRACRHGAESSDAIGCGGPSRTFDNIFGGPRPFPNADAATFGYNSKGNKVTLKERSLKNLLDLDNYYPNFLKACNAPSAPPFKIGHPSPCRMNGFDRNDVAFQQTPYQYVDYSETRPYWDIAKKYALGDKFFSGHNADSYTGHQFLFSGTSGDVDQAPEMPGVNLPIITPWGCDSPKGSTTFLTDPKTWQQTAKPVGPFPCFEYRSIADLVNAKDLTWRLYTLTKSYNINGLDANQSIWSSAQWDSFIYVRSPETSFLEDIHNPRIQLAQITWILPGLNDSDHPRVPFADGPSWVADIVNAVARSKYWDDTAIFVTWDDWGGFYDHVPPYVVRDSFGPGARVPLMVIGGYAQRGRVVHTDTEFGTLLKFAEETFGLGSLGTDDASPYLNDLDAFFDWSAPKPPAVVRTFRPSS